MCRFLIGGSVLYYPQLSSISSYQLYVEVSISCQYHLLDRFDGVILILKDTSIPQVVCEELDWLKFYPGDFSTPKQSHGHKSKREGPPNAEAIPQVLGVCSHWMQSFIKYSKWLASPSNVKAARFLSRGYVSSCYIVMELQTASFIVSEQIFLLSFLCRHKKLLDCMEEQGILR